MASIDGTMNLNSIIGTISHPVARQVITRWAFTMNRGTSGVDMQTATSTVHLVMITQIGTILRVNTIPEADGVERIPTSPATNALTVNPIGPHVLAINLHSAMAECA